MHMHARGVVPDDRLGHEGRRLAVGVGDHVDDVLIDLQVIGHLHQGLETDAELVLAGRDLVVVLLGLHPHLLELGQHLGAQVGKRIDRRHREVSALDRGAVADIAFIELLAARPRAFLGADGIEAVVHGDIEAHVVEDEELGLGTEIGGVADAALLEIGLGLLRRRAGIARIGLSGDRLVDVAEQDQGRLRGEGIEHRRIGVGQQHHVRLMDGAPAGDRGAVEHDAVDE